MLAALLAAGCAVSRKTAVPPTSRPAPSQTASKEELIARFNQQAQAIASLNAAVKMTLTAGSAYTGVIEQYHQVGGFILAQRPANIRVIGQAPVVGTDIFDMESDGETFRVFIPSKNKFLVGPAHLERPSAKPIENLRPQHLTSAIFWSAIPAGAPVLIEQFFRSPLYGLGPENYRVELGHRSRTGDSDVGIVAHNQLAMFAVEMGLFGLIPFLIICGLLLSQAWRVRALEGGLPFALALPCIITACTTANIAFHWHFYFIVGLVGGAFGAYQRRQVPVWGTSSPRGGA